MNLGLLSKYLTPPPTVAILYIIVEFSICSQESYIYKAPPFWLALFLVNIEFLIDYPSISTILNVPSGYFLSLGGKILLIIAIPPPLVAVLFI